jgi:hypothetical protein
MGHSLSSVLALQTWNLLPKSVFGFNTPYLRHAGRLIWACVIFFIGCGIVFYLTTKPKPRHKPTWAQTIFGAVLTWVLLILGYGTIPHEWLQFGAAYLNFGTDTFFIRKNQAGSHIPPFFVTRQDVIHFIVIGIYAFVLTLNVYLFVRWQKRPEPEPLEEGAAVTPGESRLRRRLRRNSAFGRPVTVNE